MAAGSPTLIPGNILNLAAQSNEVTTANKQWNGFSGSPVTAISTAFSYDGTSSIMMTTTASNQNMLSQPNTTIATASMAWGTIWVYCPVANTSTLSIINTSTLGTLATSGAVSIPANTWTALQTPPCAIPASTTIAMAVYLGTTGVIYADHAYMGNPLGLLSPALQTWDFETSVGSWSSNNANTTGVATSSTQAFSNTHSLTFVGTTGSTQTSLFQPNGNAVTAGQVLGVEAYVYLPAGAHASIDIAWYNSTPAFINNSTGSVFTNTGGAAAWIPIFNVAGAPVGAANGTFTIRTNTTTTASATYYVDYINAYSMPQDAYTLLQMQAVSDPSGYGPQPLNVQSSNGSTLLAFLAVGTNNPTGVLPKTSMSDDAHNWWQLLGSVQTATTASSTIAPGAGRIDVWGCFNAAPVNWLSPNASSIYSGMTGAFLELSGGQPFLMVDTSSSQTGISSTSSLTTGLTGVFDNILDICAVFQAGTLLSFSQTDAYPFDSNNSVTYALGGGLQLSSGNSAPDWSDVQMAAGLTSAPQPPSNYASQWTWSGASVTLPFAHLMIGLASNPGMVPTQPNQNFPGIQVEAAFGWQPGDQTGSVPNWTDISSYAVDDAGNATLATVRGRDYETTQPEAGTFTLELNNIDGTFNPMNTSSSFYPNVVPEVPVRAKANWNGQAFGLGFSYADGWPQSFPGRQWGYTQYSGKDVLGVVSQGSMPSAYAGEVLQDNPWGYWPLGEYYDNLHGGVFSNQSRNSQTPMIGWNPGGGAATETQLTQYIPALGETGQTIGLAGDPNSGIGATSMTASTWTRLASGGALVQDSSMPQFYNVNEGWTLEFWTTGIDQAGQGNGATAPLVSLYGHPWNYVWSSTGLMNNGRVLSVLASPAANIGTYSTTLSWQVLAGTRLLGTASATQTEAVFTKSASWTVPANVTSLKFEAYGGGGAGDCARSNTQGGNGGYGGAYATLTTACSPGQVFQINIGAGGGAQRGYNGGWGGATTITSSSTVIVSADFGTGPTQYPSTLAGPGAGQATNCIPTANAQNGGNRGSNPNNNLGGSGGGSSAAAGHAGGTGGNSSGNSGGAGGAVTGGGAGGHGGNKGGAGVAAGTAGGGGGGGSLGSGGTYLPGGGNGGSGYVRITYTPAALTGNEIMDMSAQSSPNLFQNVPNSGGGFTETAQLPCSHVVLTIAPNFSGAYIATMYINGVYAAQAAFTPATEMNISAIAVGGVPVNGDPVPVNNYSVGQVAVYPYALPYSRIQSHFWVGAFARQSTQLAYVPGNLPAVTGDPTWQRLQALQAWSQFSIPAAISGANEAGPLEGNADQISGTALSDAMYSLAVGNGGMYYAPATSLGELFFMERWALYNQTAMVTFGDMPEFIDNSNAGFDNITAWTLTGCTGSSVYDPTVIGNGYGNFTVNATTTSVQGLQVQPCVASNSYRLRGWFRTQGATNDLYTIYLGFYDNTGTRINSYYQAFQQQLTPGSWVFLDSRNIQAPAGAVTIHYGFTVNNSANVTSGLNFNVTQLWLTPVSSQIPYDAGMGFDYDDTYVYNIVQSQRTIQSGEYYNTIQPNSNNSAQAITSQQSYSSEGALAQVANFASETQYLPRGPLSQPTETAADSDAYDRANWSLAKYASPILRANEVKVDLEANPTMIDVVMGVEQGDVVNVVRTPAGQPKISLTCIVQKIAVNVGPNLFNVTFTLSPYFPEGAVLQADSSTMILGNSALPW